MAEWTIYFRPIGETAVDSGDGLTFDLHGKDIQSVSAVYVDGVLEDPSNYTVNSGSQIQNGSITFGVSKSGSVITVDYRWKYECSDGEIGSAYEVEKALNVRTEQDVEGRDVILVSYSRVGGFRCVLLFEYQEQAFWEEWRIAVENCYEFDIQRESLSAPLALIQNLICTEYPKFGEIPGMPGLTMVAIPCIQIT